MRICNLCGEAKPIEAFAPTRSGHRRRRCRRCVALSRPRVCFRCGRPFRADQVSTQCWRCAAAKHRERADLAFSLLGDRCARCGIRHPIHLDHVNDDGSVDRAGRGGRYSTWARKHVTELLTTGTCPHLQLLCPNCNYLKAHDREAYDRTPEYGPI